MFGASLLAFACGGRAHSDGALGAAGFAGALGGAAGELAGAPSTNGGGGTTALGDAGGAGVEEPVQPACGGGPCTARVEQLVPAAPNCEAIRLVYDAGRIYWLDIGHGSVKSISGTGGPVTTIASGGHIAAIQTNHGPLLSRDQQRVPTSPVVRNETVYWIGSANVASGETKGIGNTLLAAKAGDAPKTLLPIALDPGPSPVSSTNPLMLEQPGVNPPINAIALSPDGSTLYFAAGTRFYSIPSTGALSSADVKYVGYTQGFPDEPEGGLPTALAATEQYLFYPALAGDNVQALDLSKPCAANSAVSCGILLAYGGTTFGLLLDTLIVRDNDLYWANDSQVYRADVAQNASMSVKFTNQLSSTLQFGPISAFALGASFAYFAERGEGVSIIEKSSVSLTGQSPSVALATTKAPASSFALGSQQLYWTTSNCDIQSLVDFPQ